ncbi:MAG: S-methyl-5'-thioadenosine phosphorylase [Angustibacter sp.]
MTHPVSSDPTSSDPASSHSGAAPIAVIGGSGFYSFLDDAHEVMTETPFGAPSEPITIGSVHGRPVAFIPRHGRDHRFLPHQVNYRANLWALRSVGVRQVLAPCAVGSLKPELGPGSLVVPDQVVDRTWGRRHTVFDDLGAVVHVSMADPYCTRGRTALVSTARDADQAVRDGGTLVVVNGPRFSSRAESQWHAACGWSIVGMTGMPEAAIARELAMCYSTVALVTDLDAGLEGGDGVTHHEVLEVFAGNVERLKTLIGEVLRRMPTDDDCSCQRSLDGFRLPFSLP